MDKCELSGKLAAGPVTGALHYGVEMGQVAQLFFVIEIGTIQLN